MPATLPTVFSGSSCLYPIQKSTTYDTCVHTSYAGTEQRWKRRGVLAGFSLQYTNISTADRDGLNAFIASVKGAYDPTWSFSPASAAFVSCAFDADEFPWTETKNFPDRWNGTLKFRQTQTGGPLVPSGSQPTFPQVRPGIVTGFPYTPATHFLTDRVDLPAGPRISYAWYASGLTGFPNRALKGWGLGFQTASDSDVAVIEGHFVASGGKYLPFTFTDPDTGVPYANVRYDMDSLDITATVKGLSEFKVTLAEFWV